MIEIYEGENLEILKGFENEKFNLIYIDPPFNTGRDRVFDSIKTERDSEGDRVGFGGEKYRSHVVSSKSYSDHFTDYHSFIKERLEEAHRLLSPEGSLFFHIDYREVHYCKIILDEIFGRECFQNEIIWSYDYGARSKKKWSTKHDNILWYTKHKKKYTYNYDDIDRIPYMAPGLVGPEKAAKGKTPTDVWWNTIVSPNGKEKTGYPTQKPLAIINRIVRVHSNPEDQVLDFFGGSGTFGESAHNLGRHAFLVDNNPEAIETMRGRFEKYGESAIFHK